MLFLDDSIPEEIPESFLWPSLDRAKPCPPDRAGTFAPFSSHKLRLQHDIGFAGACRAHEREAMDLDLYSGELTISPIPLELSLNYCSHKCAFCFANLNAPDRRANVPAIMRLLAEHRTRKSAVAQLLSGGYPILFSNKVDPFAKSNFAASVPILETLAEMGIPVTFQTRGGTGIDEVLEFLPPSVWYVSISQLDDAIRARIEPGAPRIEERFELIEKLVGNGHRVVLGCNPYVQEWLPDPEPLFARAFELGAEGVWIDPIHMNRDQRAELSEREARNLGKNVLEIAGQRRPDDLAAADITNARSLARDVGLEVYSIGESERTDFWRPFQETYEHLFPTTQTLVNACWDHLPDRSLVNFSTFCSFMLPWLPESLPNKDTYIRGKAKGGRLMKQLVDENALFPNMTWTDVLRLIWNKPEISFCPARLQCFGFACRAESDGTFSPWCDESRDDGGDRIMIFDRNPINGYCVEYTEREAQEAA